MNFGSEYVYADDGEEEEEDDDENVLDSLSDRHDPRTGASHFAAPLTADSSARPPCHPSVAHSYAPLRTAQFGSRFGEPSGQPFGAPSGLCGAPSGQPFEAPSGQPFEASSGHPFAEPAVAVGAAAVAATPETWPFPSRAAYFSSPTRTLGFGAPASAGFFSSSLAGDTRRAHDSAGFSTHSRRPKADTNVVCIRFSELVAPANMHTGDPVRCTNCSAILSSLSRVTALPGGEHCWRCDFCEHDNEVHIHPQEQPRTSDVTYMISPPPQLQLSATSAQHSDSIIVFCIDISGSMSVTTEVPGRLHLKGRHVLNNYLRFVEPGFGNQSLPGRNADVTNVTRLQAVQTAIDQQLADLARTYPNRRPAIIAFNNEVTYLGDGSCEPVRIGEHNLGNREMLMKAGESAPLPGPVRDSRQNLMAKVFMLEECGRTALGPALVMAVAVAGKARGSKVVLCTDGLANVGLGNMEAEACNVRSETRSQQPADFYEDIGRVAAEKGVSVSIVTIKGTTCNLAQLSAIARRTSGEVTTVDPLNLEREFANVIRHDILATNATATFLVHKSLYIEGEDGNSMMRRVHHGNVKKNSEITFKFGVKKEYRRGLCEQLRSSAAGAPVEMAMAAASLASTDPDSTAPGGHRTTRDDDETTLMVDKTELRQTSVKRLAQETATSNHAAALVQETSTTTLVPAEVVPDSRTDVPYPTQAQFAKPFEVLHTERTASAGAAGLSSTTLANVAQRVWETTASASSSHRVPATGPAGDLSPSVGATAENRSTTQTRVPDEVCFQIQVEYTDRAGGRALRVLTTRRPLTTDRRLTEGTITPSVVCVHARQTAGFAFMQQNPGKGMRLLESTERLLSRSSATSAAVLDQFKKTVSSTREQCSIAGMTDENAASFYRHIVADSSEYVDPTDPPEEQSEDSKDGN